MSTKTLITELMSQNDTTEMTLAEYRKAIEQSEVPTEGDKLTYMALGVSGEAGEVADCAKKLRRMDNPPGDFEVQADKSQIAEELGDLLWYIDRLSATLGLTVGEILEANVEKVEERHD